MTDRADRTLFPRAGSAGPAAAARSVMSRAGFTSALSWCRQATHRESGWFLRDSRAMCWPALQVCQVYAGLIFSIRPGVFCFGRVSSAPQPRVWMPRLSPAFARTPRSGLAMVPRAGRVMPAMLRSSTRVTSKRRARSVVVFSHGSPDRARAGAAVSAGCQRPVRTRAADQRPWSRRTRSLRGPTSCRLLDPPRVRHDGRSWVPAEKLRQAWSRSRGACCWTVYDPWASHDWLVLASVSCLDSSR